MLGSPFDTLYCFVYIFIYVFLYLETGCLTALELQMYKNIPSFHLPTRDLNPILNTYAENAYPTKPSPWP